MSDHAHFHRYIWEDELVDYEGQAEKEAANATADPEKKKKVEKKATAEAKKASASSSSSSSSSKKPTTTTRKQRIAVSNFDED